MPLVVHDEPGPTFDHLPDSDHLHDSHDSQEGADGSPLELSDAGSGPRTPPALIRPLADPKHAIWPYPQSVLPKKIKKSSPHSHTPTPAKGAPPTISTFSASNLNHIHIVQPYVHAHTSDSSLASESSSKSRHPANPCTTSTFSLNPPNQSSTGQLSFANPYCTNELHTFLPNMGGGGNGPANGTTGGAGQPPRPANAWILYRSDKMKDIAPSLPGQPRPPQADISKLIAAMWKNEQPEVRQHYEALSDLKKAEHLALYPGYRFQPMKKADRERVRAEKRAEKEREKMAAMALKNYRRPKSKRGVTEESLDMQSPTTPQSMAALPWQVQVPMPAPTAVSSPTTATREHTFAYQPYASPSAPAVAPVKRKRAKTKVEAQTPVIPAEEPQQQQQQQQQQPLEYTYHPSNQYYDPNAMNYASYHPTAQYGTPQLSSTAASTDPNSLPTPPFDTMDPNLAHHQQHSEAQPSAHSGGGVPVTIEPISGQYDIFQFTNFDPSNPASEIEIALPDNWNLDFGLEGGFDSLAGFEGFGDLANLESFTSGPGLLDGVEGLEGLGIGMVDPNSLNFPAESMGYPNSFGGMDASTNVSNHGHPQGLTISTQALQPSHAHSHSMSESVASPVVETPLSAGGGHFGSFQIQQQPQVYGGPSQFSSQSRHLQQGFMSPQGFQTLLSPTHSSQFASPPPMSVIDESGTPGSEVYASSSGRGGRQATPKWR